MKTESKEGYVYFLEVTFPSGKQTIYTGETSRTPWIRFKDHIRNVKKHRTWTYTGRAKKLKILGAIKSKDRKKTEKEMKQLPREEKIRIAKAGARKWRRLKRRGRRRRYK